MAAEKITPKLPKGMRDILPDKMILRQYVIGVIQQVFEEFGFEPLLTPAIELSSTLMGKYGPEAERLIYDAHHRGGQVGLSLPPEVEAYLRAHDLIIAKRPSEELSLRYDLSVPLCRLMAMYPDLPKPFKRYQISPVWRAERPQKGRYREFWQCDADTVGSSSMLADAETIAIIYDVLKRLGFSQFVTKINDRKVLTGIGQFAQVPPEQLPDLYRSIDKLAKVGLDGVREELRTRGIPEDTIGRLLDLLQVRGESRTILSEMRQRLSAYPSAVEGIGELEDLLTYVDVLGVPKKCYEVDFSMVRGLDYYTGPIFETVVEKPKIGSITGGGRFDNLVGMFLDRSYPATGTTIGIERIIDVMDELGMYPPHVRRTPVQVLVTIFDQSLVTESLALSAELRQGGVKALLFYDGGPLSEQISYARRKGIPLVVILGPEEAAAGEVIIRKSRDEQHRVKRGEAAAFVKEALAA